MASFASEFFDMAVQTVCWAPMVSRDQYGKPSFGPVQTFLGRRVFKNSRVASYERGTKGQGPEVISESEIIILAALSLTYDDRVYVAGDDLTRLPPILSWGRNPDETGQDVFTKVMLGSANG